MRSTSEGISITNTNTIIPTINIIMNIPSMCMATDWMWIRAVLCIPPTQTS